MNCTGSLEKLYQYLDGDLDKAPKGDIEKHLKRCLECWDRFEFEKRLIERFKASCCKEVCPDTLRRRIQSLLEKY